MAKKTTKKQTTALARRTTAPPSKKKAYDKAMVKRHAAAGVQVVPAVVPVQIEHLTDDPMVIDLAIVPRFTAEEELVLSEKVPNEEILIKPTGQIYASHPTYTRWFNRAFGRAQWGLQQIQKAQRIDNNILITYCFVLRGMKLFTAVGEAEYITNNREQTFGDVLEATYAYALRRIAKRLGVGLELWDKAFVNDWIAKNAVAVWTTEKNGDRASKPKWRLKNAPPLPYESGIVRPAHEEQFERQQRRQSGDYAPARGQAPLQHPRGEETITDKQVGRLIGMAKRMDRTDEDIKAFILKEYGLTSKKQIKRKDYEDICASVEQPGPLQRATAARQDRDDEPVSGQWEINDDEMAAENAQRLLNRR